MLTKRKRNRTRTERRAAAVVEMAVVMPILLTLLFGIVEFGWTFMTFQAIVNAAREGARVAILEGSTTTDVQNRVAQCMNMVGLKTSDYTLTLDRASTSVPTETVTIAVPYGKVSLLNGYFGGTSFKLTGKASMRKEGTQ